MKKVIDIIWSIFWLIVRRKKADDDPNNQYQKAKRENAEAIRTGDEATVNRKLSSGTDQLRSPKDGRY